MFPFTQWFTPTRTVVELPPSTTFQRNKSQRNWLFKTHPQAFLGNLGLSQLIHEEETSQDSSHKGQGSGSVLAVGEIADFKGARSSDGARPVVAMAAGQAGHILQLSTITPEKWTWKDSALTIGTSQSPFKGSWCNDGSPLTQIKFAMKSGQPNSTRWMIAQKETLTTIFEPELMSKPVTGRDSFAGLALGNADHIAMNPLVTLKADMTGGNAHSDFAINMGLEEESPQLAVIDISGNWYIWFISRPDRGRTRVAKPVLVKTGGWSWPFDEPLLSEMSPPRRPHGIIWVSRQLRRDDEWERDSNLSEDTVFAPDASPFLAGAHSSDSRSDSILVYNHIQLQVLDIKGQKPASRLDLSRRDGRDQLLEAQAYRGSASHVFVLTTEKLHLVDVSCAENQESKPPSVLLSCHHLRGDHGDSLKMSVFRLPSSKIQLCNLVLLSSVHNTRIDMLWFTISQEDKIARFHRQVLQLPNLDIVEVSGLRGIQSLAAVPLPLSTVKEESQVVSAPARKDGTRDDTQFYQLLSLGTDLSLNSSVVAVTPGQFLRVAEPVKVGSSQWNEQRRGKFLRNKYLREAERAFVLPDEAEAQNQLSIFQKPGTSGKREVAQMRFYLLRLLQEINRGLATPQVADNAAEPGSIDTIKAIRERVDTWEEGLCVSLKPLLGFSDTWQHTSLDAVEDEWTSSMQKLKHTGQARVFDCGRYGSGLNAMDLFERISVNWSARLPAESLKASQWGYMELALQKMAADVFMSERGIYMVPPSISDLALKSSTNKENDEIGSSNPWDEPLSSPRARTEQILPTPSATPSSSRANSEAVDIEMVDREEAGPEQEDPAVARLRMYLPSIKFTPPARGGPTRLISLWPEQRGVDPTEYSYVPWGKGPDAQARAAKRKLEKEEHRRRKAERLALLRIQPQRAGSSFSQAGEVQSSPLRQSVYSKPLGMEFGGQSQRGSQAQSQSQSQNFNFSQGLGFSQTMSQPLPGGFGQRVSRVKKKNRETLKKPGFK